MNRRNELLVRVYIVMTFFVLLSLLIIAKVFYVNVIEGKKWRSKISKNVKLIDIKGDRGNIYAKDGSMLAITSPLFDVRMDLLSPSEKNFNKYVDSLAYYISTELRQDKSPGEWKRILTEGRRLGLQKKKKGMKFFLIKGNINYDELIKVKNFPLFKLGQNRGGLIIERKTKRNRPYKDLAHRTIGIDRATASKVGLEGAYDKYLKGETTKRLMKKLRGGAWIPVEEINDKPLSKGDDIVTSLDIRIQDIVHHSLLSNLQNINAEAGVGVIMEVETGKVVAISNLSKNKDGAFVERLNLAIGKKFAPGSVMKTATLMALIEDGHIDMNSTIDLEGGRKNFRGKIIKDDEDIGRGRRVKLWDVLVHSSNVGSAKWADLYYNKDRNANKKFIDKLKSFGLNQKTGIDLIGEVKPYIKDPFLNKREFNRNTIPWMAHGYELELTPLQLLTFYNAIANNGKLMKPYLVNKIISQDNTIEIKPKVLIEKIASRNTIKIMKELLKGVVQEGTGSKLKNLKVGIAGKTGTAQEEVKNSDGENRYNSSFVGFFPADKPKYSMIVTMFGCKKPKYYASQVAVPVFGKIVEKIASIEAFDKEGRQETAIAGIELPNKAIGYTEDFKNVLTYLEIPFKRENRGSWSKVNRRSNKMQVDEFQFKSKLVPNVIGMGARDAIYLLENLGLKVELEGYGKVVEQSIPPKTRRNKQNIKLILK